MQLRWMAGTQAGGAVSFCELDEVGSPLHVHVGVVAVVKNFLPLAHHAQRVVVHDDDFCVGPILDCSSQFLSGHLEAAIADEGNDLAIREGQLSAQRGGEAVTHSAESAGSE